MSQKHREVSIFPFTLLNVELWKLLEATAQCRSGLAPWFPKAPPPTPEREAGNTTVPMPVTRLHLTFHFTAWVT